MSDYTDDVSALVEGQKYIKAIIPAMVNIVYKKLLKYDITARVFTTRDTRNEAPIDKWVTEESTQIQHRKMVGWIYIYIKIIRDGHTQSIRTDLTVSTL